MCNHHFLLISVKFTHESCEQHLIIKFLEAHGFGFYILHHSSFDSKLSQIIFWQIWASKFSLFSIIISYLDNAGIKIRTSILILDYFWPIVYAKVNTWFEINILLLDYTKHSLVRWPPKKEKKRLVRSSIFEFFVIL